MPQVTRVTASSAVLASPRPAQHAVRGRADESVAPAPRRTAASYPQPCASSASPASLGWKKERKHHRRGPLSSVYYFKCDPKRAHARGVFLCTARSACAVFCAVNPGTECFAVKEVLSESQAKPSQAKPSQAKLSALGPRAQPPAGRASRGTRRPPGPGAASPTEWRSPA